MKHWVSFTTLETQKYNYKKNSFDKFNKPLHVGGLGSFSNIQFDQRYCLDNIINKAFDYMNRNKVDNFSGFIIYNNTWLNETNKIYQYKKTI